jgi:hypothetical protein
VNERQCGADRGKPCESASNKTDPDPHEPSREASHYERSLARAFRRVAYAVVNTTRLPRLCERELEGIVAKRLDGRYRPGERGWIKIKNRDYWRYELERESAKNKPRVKQFV